ncbi:hypothetical protein J6590_008351 [Homalodisca vitripennis]|nr:hypothetical protein J6590_008351 [Homalodisca vitripennis]
MATIMTRCVRSNLLKTTQDDLSSLKEELIHDEVIDSAIQFHSIPKVIAHIYSNDAVVDLIPELTQLLHKLDAALKVNDDLKKSLSAIHEENSDMKKCLDIEKLNKKQVLEESLSLEDSMENQIKLLKAEIKTLKDFINKTVRKNGDEEIIISTLKQNSEKMFKECAVQQQNNCVAPPEISPEENDSPKSEKYKQDKNNVKPSFETKDAKPNTKSQNNIKAGIKQHRKTQQPNKKVRRKVNVYSDSHGRHMSMHLMSHLDNNEYKVMVECKPGTDIFPNILDSEFCEDDWVVLIAGTNNISNSNENNVFRRYKNLIEKLKTPRIIAVTIPYRFDMQNSHKVNEKTFLVNRLLKRLEEEVPKMKIVDTESMDRKYFTRHELHLTEKGKDALSRLIADCISENAIATSSDKRVSGIKEIAVANSPYTRRIEPCVLSPSAANKAIATELIEEQNTPSCSLVGATYDATMKGNATQSPSIRPSEAFKLSTEPGAQVSSSSIDITSLSSQSQSGVFLETRQVHSPTT